MFPQQELPGTPSSPLLSLSSLTLNLGIYCVETIASYEFTPLISSVQTHIQVKKNSETYL